MQAESTMTGVRTLVAIAMLAVGLALGAAVPVLAEVGGSEISTACGAVEAMSTGGSEWAVPPSPGLPGEPY